MFSNFLEKSQSQMELTEIDPEIFDLILSYIYTGDIIVNSLNVQDIARASNMLELVDLVDYCSKYMESSIRTKNCIGILCFADFYQLQSLCFKAKRFVERNYAEVCFEAEFLDLPITLLRGFLRSENLSIDDEFQVLKSTIKWILSDASNRIAHLEECISLIRMPLITSIQMKELIDNCPDGAVRFTLSSLLKNGDEKTEESTDYNIIRYQPRMCLRRRIYVCGGLNIRYPERQSPHTLPTMFRYNLHTAQWDNDPPFFYPRSSHCVVQLSGKLYIIGGECDSLILDTMEIFDPNSHDGNKWERGPNMIQPRSSFGACVHGSNIYAFGGKGLCASQTIEQYDSNDQQWKYFDRMPKPRYAMHVVQFNGLIYIIGGRCENNQTKNTLFSYDPTTKQFKVLASMKMARSDFGCAVLHGNIYVFGGLDSTGEPLTTVEQYNITEVNIFVYLKLNLIFLIYLYRINGHSYAR